MAFYFSDPEIGLPSLLTWETTQASGLPLGTIRAVRDTTYGEGRAMYCKLTASAVAVGNPVVYDTKNATGILAVTTARGPVGIAIAASSVANVFGWLIVKGAVPIVSNAMIADAPVFATAVAGTVDDAVSATNKIDGAISAEVTSAGSTVCEVEYPAMNGNG